MVRRRRHSNAWITPGLCAGVLALAFSWAASRLDPGLPFTPLSLAERVIRLTPGDAATLAIEQLGSSASHLLAVAITVGFVVAGAVLPRLTAAGERLRPYLAGATFAVALGLAGVVAPMRSALLAIIGVAALAGLLYGTSLAWMGAMRARADAPEQDLGRRRALIGVGSAALGLLLGGSLLGRALGDRGPDTAVALRRGRRAVSEPTTGGFPDVPGLSAEVTSVADHYVVDIDVVDPSVEAEGWRLEVGGLVKRPQSLGFEELQRRFEVVEEISVLTCISNEVGGPLVGNSAWTGVRLADVLTAAGVKDGAVDVVLRCADGYDVSIPVARAIEPTTLLALGQAGRPLTQEHGSPAVSAYRRCTG